ncbi:alpha-2-macroglobulin [Filomicrobium sp.]|uniref:alpha-2-macroglobulin family protein n=1 Tax=Filomicrobium sp. TaxID=2024831 RepID=UPI0025873FFB|nr:alpha-2-macroglobulin [Filomicrobium sp.]MCV0368237.1 alpha-2-macroglobulin family protein [Filomicrobium sp.]
MHSFSPRRFVEAALLLATVTAAFLITFLPAAAQEAKFAHQQLEEDAKRYESYLVENWADRNANIKTLLAKGGQDLGKDPRAASRSFAAAAGSARSNSAAWLGLARSLIAINPNQLNGSERYDIPVNASGAAYRAYQHASGNAQKAEALSVLADTLQRREFWRPALEALKVSLALADNPKVRATYDKLHSAHGFRMTDYSTQTETNSPRLCLQFSESLARGPVEFADFISVNGKDAQAVTPEGSQLCIDGLAHGQRYEVQLRAGLPSEIGETLEKTIEIAAYLPDRKPTVRFTGRAYVLPARGQQGIPVVSVNTDTVQVEVFRFGDRALAGAVINGDLQRQLSSWDLETIKSQSGESVYTGNLTVKRDLNKEVTTAFPVNEAIGTLKPGAYVMTAQAATPTSDYQNTIATQWFIVSDLGLTAFSGRDGVHAFVRSLSEAHAVREVEVRLIARNNEVLATAKTDANGYVKFDGALARGEGGLQPAILVAQNGLSDYAFLDMTTAAFDLSDRGVKGREPSGPIDAFVYTERGVYRPGEDVHVAALVRDDEGKSSNLPVTLIVTRPDGVEHQRLTLVDEGSGGRAALLPLSHGAMTGTWRAQVHVDPKAAPIAQAAFLVEDFVPERLDMTLSPKSASIGVNDPATIAVTGRYLYGPPAAGLKMEGDVIVRTSSSGVPGYSGYRFGQSDEEITPVRESLNEIATTSQKGEADLSISLPKVVKTAKPLEAKVLVRLAEPGGRTIERQVTLPVDLGLERIGIKPLFNGDRLGESETAQFDVLMLGTDGKPEAASGLVWQLNKLETNWQWYSRGGYWTFEPVTLTRKVADGKLEVAAEKPSRLEMPVKYGRYVLEVQSAGSAEVVSSVAFTAGWYSGSDRPDSPEQLDIALDKETYQPGDTAKLRIAAKQGGKALVAVLGNRLYAMQEVDVPTGGGDVSIPVGDNWGPGAYVTAILYRPMDEALKRMPQRSLGLQWLALDQTKRTLNIALNAPDKIESGATLRVPIKVSGFSAGETARLTLAAVDVGILNLTNYKAPKPQTWFYAQTQLGHDIRDYYGRLIDGMRAERGTLRSGGDADAGMQMQGSPPVEATVAKFSGIVEVSSDGSAEVEFDLPEFNGSVRLMAVAWSDSSVGSATMDVIVRDPVALTVAGPRFLTLGDKAQLALDVHNVEGPEATYVVNVAHEVTAGAQVSLIQRDVALKTEERRSERLSLEPKSVGLQTYHVNITGPDGIDVARTLTFDVKAPAGDIKRTTIASIKANGGSLSLSADLLHDLIPDRSEINLSVGPAARFDVPGLLAQLDRYPYGCAEQTVSRALPLVYASAVAQRSGVKIEADLSDRVQKAIDRVFEMQDASGAFGAWGPGNTNMWLTSFVTDFLTRAKEAGHKVREPGFTQALDRLQNFIAYAQDFESGGEDRAYALYVLARNARAPIGELRYYVDTRLDRFSTPLAKAQLGAALAMMGDKERSGIAFKAAYADLTGSEAQVISLRDDYGSRLRDGAALVALSAETGMENERIPHLIDVVASGYTNRRYTSTQEQAWLLLAVKALGDESASASLTIGGTAHSGPLARKLTAEELNTGSFKVTNESDADLDAVISVVGASLNAEPAVSNGFSIERSYFKLDGTAVDLASANGGKASIAQNERLVTVVKMTADNAGGRVLVVDRLPAGFEVENPRLVASGDLSSLSWLKSDVSPEHTEFRDDRVVAAFNLFGQSRSDVKAAGMTATVAYIVRAVTPGEFVHPAATVEDMYVPERHARTEAGTLTVTGKN